MSVRNKHVTVDQVLHLTSTIEYGFEHRQKLGVVLLDLTAAYDTASHQGLRLKLLRKLPDYRMVAFIMETLSNRQFTLHTSNRRSRPRRLKNGKQHSKQHVYADDLAIVCSNSSWNCVERTPNKDLETLGKYGL